MSKICFLFFNLFILVAIGMSQETRKPSYWVVTYADSNIKQNGRHIHKNDTLTTLEGLSPANCGEKCLELLPFTKNHKALPRINPLKKDSKHSSSALKSRSRSSFETDSLTILCDTLYITPIQLSPNSYYEICCSTNDTLISKRIYCPKGIIAIPSSFFYPLDGEVKVNIYIPATTEYSRILLYQELIFFICDEHFLY